MSKTTPRFPVRADDVYASLGDYVSRIGPTDLHENPFYGRSRVLHSPAFTSRGSDYSGSKLVEAEINADALRTNLPEFYNLEPHENLDVLFVEAFEPNPTVLRGEINPTEVKSDEWREVENFDSRIGEAYYDGALLVKSRPQRMAPKRWNFVIQEREGFNSYGESMREDTKERFDLVDRDLWQAVELLEKDSDDII